MNSPTSASTTAPDLGPSPRSVRKAGRCVAMKTTWKPQTKKPKQSSQKPWCPSASPSTSRRLRAGAYPVAVAGFSPSAIASGAMSRPTAAKPSSVAALPKASMALSAPGNMANWPSEPTAMAIPMAMLRRSGSVERTTAPKTTGMVVPESPRPMMSPAETASAVPVCDQAINTSPPT